MRRRHSNGEIVRQLFPASKASGKLTVRLVKHLELNNKNIQKKILPPKHQEDLQSG